MCISPVQYIVHIFNLGEKRRVCAVWSVMHISLSSVCVVEIWIYVRIPNQRKYTVFRRKSGEKLKFKKASWGEKPQPWLIFGTFGSTIHWSMQSHRTSVRLLYWLTLASGMLECLFFSGVVFGYASLVFVLKEDGYFSHLCFNGPDSNGTTVEGKKPIYTVLSTKTVTFRSSAIYLQSEHEGENISIMRELQTLQ